MIYFITLIYQISKNKNEIYIVFNCQNGSWCGICFIRVFNFITKNIFRSQLQRFPHNLLWRTIHRSKRHSNTMTFAHTSLTFLYSFLQPFKLIFHNLIHSFVYFSFPIQWLVYFIFYIFSMHSFDYILIHSLLTHLFSIPLSILLHSVYKIFDFKLKVIAYRFLLALKIVDTVSIVA